MPPSKKKNLPALRKPTCPSILTILKTSSSINQFRHFLRGLYLSFVVDDLRNLHSPLRFLTSSLSLRCLALLFSKESYTPMPLYSFRYVIIHTFFITFFHFEILLWGKQVWLREGQSLVEFLSYEICAVLVSFYLLCMVLIALHVCWADQKQIACEMVHLNSAGSSWHFTGCSPVCL